MRSIFLKLFIILLWLNLPSQSQAKQHTSSFGFSYELPEHWVVLSKEEAGMRFAPQTTQSLGSVGYTRSQKVSDDLLTKIKSEQVEFLFDTKHSTPEFDSHISIQLKQSRAASSSKAIERACSSIEEDLETVFSNKVDLIQCDREVLNEFEFLTYSYKDAYPGTTTLQHEFQITHNVTLVLVGGSNKSGYQALKTAQMKLADRITQHFYPHKNKLEKAVAEMGKGNFKDSIIQFKWLAQYGDDDALYNLGVHYDNGDGVEQNFQRAKTYYEQAAKAGNHLAMTNLASMYYNGRGTGKDVIRSAALYKTAAEAGVAIAQTSYGGMLYQGVGVEKDPNTAMRWFLKAAEQGDQKASQNLIRIYSLQAETGNLGAVQAMAGLFFQGIGVEKDLSKGLKLLTSAAEAGYRPSQKALARIYSDGLYGVPANPQLAKKWQQEPESQ